MKQNVSFNELSIHIHTAAKTQQGFPIVNEMNLNEQGTSLTRKSFYVFMVIRKRSHFNTIDFIYGWIPSIKFEAGTSNIVESFKIVWIEGISSPFS